jgi:hypothetical protein
MQVSVYLNGTKRGMGTVVVQPARQLAPGRGVPDRAQLTVGPSLALTLLAAFNNNSSSVELEFSDGSRRGLRMMTQANGVIDGDLL